MAIRVLVVDDSLVERLLVESLLPRIPVIEWNLRQMAGRHSRQSLTVLPILSSLI